MSVTGACDRFTALPYEKTLTETVVALEEHGFSVEVVDDLYAARAAVLARIPEGSSVMANTPVMLQETGIADAINDGGGRYDSVRNKISRSTSRPRRSLTSTWCPSPDQLGQLHARAAIDLGRAMESRS